MEKPRSTKARKGSLWSFLRGKKGIERWDKPRSISSNHHCYSLENCREICNSVVFPKTQSTNSNGNEPLDAEDSMKFPQNPHIGNPTPVRTETPGIVGMHNLGNTCYFNATLQCLAHVDVFSEYFAMDNYMDDISSATLPIAKKSKKKNSFNNNKGELTYMLAVTIKSLWHSDLYSIDVARELHEVVGYYERQYSGAEEHDAQEFLMWLINKVHEESVRTPRNKEKDLLKKKKSCGNEDEQAVLAFASFTQYHQSYIQGLFLSQYRSSITCSNCKQQSNTFDPYTCVSLSIPQPSTRNIVITLVYSLLSISPLKVAFILESTAKIHDLKQKISSKYKFENFILIELLSDGAYKFINDDHSIGVLCKEENSIYALEVGNKSYFGVKEKDGQIEKYETQNADNLVLVVSNVEVSGKEHRRFGIPVAINVTTDLSFKQIQVIIRKNMSSVVRNTLNKVIKEKQVKLGLHVINSNSDLKYFLCNDVGNPLQSESVAKSIRESVDSDQHYLFLVAEWEPIPSGWYMNKVGITIGTDDESTLIAREKSANYVIDLEDCLKLQTQEETLTEEWKCPCCGVKQGGVVKRLTLWSLPDILVLHLKRFNQVDGFNEKISTVVNFPVNALNMSPYVATTSSKLNSKLYKKESLKLSYQPPPQTVDQCIYDLKAVCYHIGTHLNSGHYTASCFNSANGNWYYFDDRSVRMINEKEIITSGSYLLFYERRWLSSRIPNGTYKSISRARSSPCQHWSYKIHRPEMRSFSLHQLVRKDDKVGI